MLSLHTACCVAIVPLLVLFGPITAPAPPAHPCYLYCKFVFTSKSFISCLRIVTSRQVKKKCFAIFLEKYHKPVSFFPVPQSTTKKVFSIGVCLQKSVDALVGRLIKWCQITVLFAVLFDFAACRLFWWCCMLWHIDSKAKKSKKNRTYRQPCTVCTTYINTVYCTRQQLRNYYFKLGSRLVLQVLPKVHLGPLASVNY